MTLTLNGSATETATDSGAGGGVVGAKNATVTILTPFHPLAEDEAERLFGKVLRPASHSYIEGGVEDGEAVRDSHGVLLRVGRLTDDMIRSSSKLRIISRNGTGIDNLDADACRDKGVVVTNMPGGNAQAVAELALTLTLTLLRRVSELDARLRAGEVVRSIDVLAPGLFGKTVGLVGMGDTAYEFARLLTPFGCRILVCSPTSPPTRWTEADTRAKDGTPRTISHTRVTFGEMLGEADVVSLHCPLTAKTRNLVGAKEFERMKKTAVVINTARGGMIDETALAQALKEREIAGAGIDVWVKEPPSLDSMGQLAELDNVVCLPHLGGSTDQVTYEGCMGAVKIMADFFDGKGARNRVL